jgi:cytochrome c oxidase subunit IV
MEHADSHGHAESGAHHVDLKKHVRTYMMVFGSLMVLTIVTVAVKYLDLSVWPAIMVALVIATVKGSLVACYFMHLISERKLILILMASTVFFFLGVLLGPVLTELNEINPVK